MNYKRCLLCLICSFILCREEEEKFKPFGNDYFPVREGMRWIYEEYSGKTEIDTSYITISFFNILDSDTVVSFKKTLSYGGYQTWNVVKNGSQIFELYDDKKYLAYDFRSIKGDSIHINIGESSFIRITEEVNVEYKGKSKIFKNCFVFSLEIAEDNALIQKEWYCKGYGLVYYEMNGISGELLNFFVERN